MGPIEASMRERAIEARRRLAGHVPVQIIERLALMAATPPTKAERVIYEPAQNPTPSENIPDPMRWKAIIDEVCTKHRVAKEAVFGQQRSRELVSARFEAYYRLSTETRLSLPQIGDRMGGKDHTSVIHGIRAYRRRHPELVQ